MPDHEELDLHFLFGEASSMEADEAGEEADSADLPG